MREKKYDNTEHAKRRSFSNRTLEFLVNRHFIIDIYNNLFFNDGRYFVVIWGKSERHVIYESWFGILILSEIF